MINNLVNKILTVLSSYRLILLFFLTVLQSHSLFAQESLTGSAGFTKNRETYYEASKQKVLGNYETAAELYRKCLEYDPADAAAMYELANIYTNQGKIQEALPFAEKAVETDPLNKWYKTLLIRLYQAQGKYTDAGRIIEQLTSG